MKALHHYIFLVLVYIILLTGCVEPYAPPVIESDVNYLVVDGFVNSSDGTATVKLSRAIALSSTATPPPEVGATISVEDDNGNSTPLSDDGSGNYTGAGIPITMASKYRLRILTTDKKEYISDYIELKQTPAIDELSWVPTDAGTKIVVTTHDDTGNTRYYQWSYDETWEYTAVFLSGLIYVNDTVDVRPYDEYIYRCWRTTSSQTIIIGSSDRLQEDLISEFPLITIPVGSQKLFINIVCC